MAEARVRLPLGTFWPYRGRKESSSAQKVVRKSETPSPARLRSTSYFLSRQHRRRRTFPHDMHQDRCGRTVRRRPVKATIGGSNPPAGAVCGGRRQTETTRIGSMIHKIITELHYQRKG